MSYNYKNQNYSTTIYKILKIIDYCFDTKTFQYPQSFNKLNLYPHKLVLILSNLQNAGLIQGITEPHPNHLAMMPILDFNNLSLTLDGMLFLEENSSMKKAYRALKEVLDWLPT